MDDNRALVGMRFAHISGPAAHKRLRDGADASAPLRVGSGLARAPDILPAHHGVIGKGHAFLNAVLPRARLFATRAGAAGKNKIDLKRWSSRQLWRCALRRGTSRQVQVAIHKTTFRTIMGNISFGPEGEWTKSRVIYTQARGIVGNDLEQFKQAGREVIVWPPEFKTGNLQYPYAQ